MCYNYRKANLRSQLMARITALIKGTSCLFGKEKSKSKSMDYLLIYAGSGGIVEIECLANYTGCQG